MKMLLGITGTDGSGKGTVVEYLVKEKGFTHYSSRTFILEHIDKEGFPRTRNQMRLTANKLRARHGDAFVVKQAYEKALEDGKEYVVIESLRAVAEADFLKGKGGVLIAVDADVKLRYKRVQERRSESDMVTFEEFVAHEALEAEDPDPHGMQKLKVIQMADYIVLNNGTLEELHTQIEEVLQKIKSTKVS